MKRFLFLFQIILICFLAGCKDDIPVENPSDNATITEYADYIRQEYGETSDFGLAYGTARMICEKRKLRKNVPVDFDISTMDSENVWKVDFSLPEFDEKIVGRDSAEIVGFLSYRFVKYIYESHGWAVLEELLRSAPGDDAKVALKNEWLQKEGCTVTYEPVAAYSFEVNDNEYKKDYPYFVKEDGYNMFFSIKDINKAGFKAYFEGYRPIHNLAADDFKEARARFWRDNKRTDSVADIYTDFSKNEKLYSAQYFPNEDRIVLYQNWDYAAVSLLHEYVHFLDGDNFKFTFNPILESYTEEFAAYEYSGKMRQYGYKNTAEEFSLFEKLGIYDSEQDYLDIPLLNDYEATLFYMGEVKAWGSVYYDKAVYSDGREYYSYLEMPYYAAASFYKFLLEKYGEERVHKASGINYDFTALWGDDYPSLYKEWGDGLLEKYEAELLHLKDLTK